MAPSSLADALYERAEQAGYQRGALNSKLPEADAQVRQEAEKLKAEAIEIRTVKK